ncbi:MAG: alpha/beta hydrolase [Nocardioides sp.]|nr:alpha/beta hydrolase [Nocardioides sp.]
MSHLKDRVDAAALRLVLSLPTPVQRVLAGRPVVKDGLTLETETQLLLRMQKLVREPGAETLPIPLGRRAIRRQSRLSGGDLPIREIRDLDLDGLPGRLYVPTSAPVGGGADPTLLFLHGGGFVYGDLDSHDATCRLLAERAGVRVLSVDYRLAPEHPFPAAHDDAVAAYRWLLEHADRVGADPARISVGGDSAGGSLAAWVARYAAHEGLPLRHQLLVYPTTDQLGDTASSRMFDEGFYLTRGFMDLADSSYARSDDDRASEQLSPLRHPVPAGLAPAYLCTAGFDPLRDEGEAYADQLRAAGVDVVSRRFEGHIHSFFNVVGVGRAARGAVEEIADALRAGLARG